MDLESGGRIAPVDWALMEARLSSQDDSNPVVCSRGINVLWGMPIPDTVSADQYSRNPADGYGSKLPKIRSQNLWGSGKIVPLLEPVNYVAKPLVLWCSLLSLSASHQRFSMK